MPTPLVPHPIFGTVTLGENLKIIIKNATTGDELTIITDNSGKYVTDAGNFTNGYTSGDKLQLIIDELPIYTDNITIDNGDIRLT